MDTSQNSAGNVDGQNAAQNHAAGQGAIAHQVVQPNNNGNNGVLQQPLTSNSPAAQVNASPLGPNINNQNGATGSLPCEWIGCGQRAANAETLYEHVCEVHVGRRSTNNLNLTCGWGSCRTATVKRDHITSHIRVHIPLKPHVCHACSKKFKRPQDLKKHVKTHADEPDTQDGSNGNRGHHGPTYGGQGQQRVFYPEHPVQSSGGISYPFQGHAGQANYYAPTQQQQGGGSNGYAAFYGVDPNTNTHGNMSYHGNSYPTESRKRGVDVMNDFFGDAKRGRFDPSSYSEVGQRLLAFNGVQLPLPTHGAGTGGMLAEYLAQQSPPTPTIVQASSHRGSMGGLYGPSAQAYQALPSMPNIRSKRDLQVVDQMLDQTLQAVYRNMPNNGMTIVTQQVHDQPHSSHASMHGLRASNSPPGMHLNTHSAMAASIHGSTPALTPSGSTVQSQSSGHSPTSNHDADLADFEATNLHPQQMMGQNMQASSHNVMYPSLPSTNGAQGGYNVAPSANLGTHFDREVRRRQGGGRLGKARPADFESMHEGSADSSALNDNKGSAEGSEPAKKKRAYETKEARFSRLNIDPNIDPALAGPAPSTSSTTPSMSESEPGTPATAGGMAKTRVTEQDPSADVLVWEGNMELLLRLKGYVRARLELGEWQGGSDGDGEQETREDVAMKREVVNGEMSGQGLYPVLSAGGE